MKKNLIGLMLGLVIGLLDFVIYYLMNNEIILPLAIAGILFWINVGWAIFSLRIDKNIIFRSILASVFLHLPWLVIYKFVFNQDIQLLLTMIFFAILFGAIIGYFKTIKQLV